MKTSRAPIPFRLYVPLLLFGLMFLLSTCKKDENNSCNGCGHEQGFQQVKDWMYFKTGSYWIYEEEDSGAIDTIRVWDAAQGQSGGYDAFHCFTESSYDGYYYMYQYNASFTTDCLNTRNCTCEKVERSKGRPGDFVGGAGYSPFLR